MSVQLKQWSYKTRFVKGKKSIATKKIVIIGDSNQAFLLPLKIALLLGCPVFSGHEDKSNRAYCSSSDWPEVKKYTTSEKKYKISLQSLFPWASMEIRVPKVLEKLHADEDTVLILQSSTNDITNLREGTDREAMTEKSARQMITDFTLQKVIILGKGSRKNETTYSTFDTQHLILNIVEISLYYIVKIS